MSEPPVPGAAGYSVNMIRPHLHDIPDVPFPPGYGVRGMLPGDEPLWTDIQRDAEPFFSVGDGLFTQAFGTDAAEIERRCYILTAPDGSGAGVLSAWRDPDFRGQDYGRIHWVAVRRGHQGRGLGKAGLAYALGRLALWHTRAYLDTQTNRVPAIRMYLDFGFLPDLDEPYASLRWHELRQQISHPGLAALDQG